MKAKTKLWLTDKIIGIIATCFLVLSTVWYAAYSDDKPLIQTLIMGIPVAFIIGVVMCILLLIQDSLERKWKPIAEKENERGTT